MELGPEKLARMWRKTGQNCAKWPKLVPLLSVIDRFNRAIATVYYQNQNSEAFREALERSRRVLIGTLTKTR